MNMYFYGLLLWLVFFVRMILSVFDATFYVVSFVLIRRASVLDNFLMMLCYDVYIVSVLLLIVMCMFCLCVFVGSLMVIFIVDVV